MLKSRSICEKIHGKVTAPPQLAVDPDYIHGHAMPIHQTRKRSKSRGQHPITPARKVRSRLQLLTSRRRSFSLGHKRFNLSSKCAVRLPAHVQRNQRHYIQCHKEVEPSENISDETRSRFRDWLLPIDGAFYKSTLRAEKHR